MKTYYIVSGGFDPIHEGHIAMFKEAAAKSDGIIVLLNSDAWLMRKKGKAFMEFKTRMEICDNIKQVLDVFGFDDSDNSACDGIRIVREHYPLARLIFANGGDRNAGNIPEHVACEKYGVTLEFAVGGDDKKNSSSLILGKWKSE